MDDSYYQYTRGLFGKWAWFYNFIALPLTGVRSKVADLVDEEDKIKIPDVCTGTGTQAFAFAKRDLEELFREHGLKVIQEAYGLVDFVGILLCERESVGRKG